MTRENVVRKVVTVNAPIEHVFEVFTPALRQPSD